MDRKKMLVTVLRRSNQRYQYTANLTGNQTAGTLFNVNADFFMGFTVTTLATGFRIQFRRQDETHYWFVEGGADGKLILYKRNGASYTSQSSAAGVITNGSKVLVVANGGTVTFYVNDAQVFAQTGITDYVTATGGKIEGIYTTGVMTNLFAVALNANMLVAGSPNQADIAYLFGKRGLVIFDGDSRSTTSTPLFTMQNAAITPYNYGFAKTAVNGQGFDEMIPRIQTAIAPLAIPGIPASKQVVVVWAGVNDSDYTDMSVLYGRLVTYCAAIRATGRKVIISSEIAAADALRVANDWANKFPTLNTHIGAGAATIADGFVNLGVDARLLNPLDTTYFNTDKVHLITAGQQVVADLDAPILAAVLATL